MPSSQPTPLWASVDQAIWLAKRQGPRRRYRRLWTRDMVADLEAMVGKKTVGEMAEHFGLTLAQISQKLGCLGYKVTRDVHNPLGRNAHAAAKLIGVPYEWLWKQIRAGKVKAPKKDRKDYFLRWREIGRLSRLVAEHVARRERALARIKEPTITRTEFDRMINLSEVQSTRYLKGKIVKAWKVPMPWAGDTNRDRWEWRISKRDAERVTRLRAEGKLQPRRKEFRALVKYENAKVTALRKARRLGTHEELRHKLSCVIPGYYSVAAVAAQAGISVSQRTYRAVKPEALPAYLAWVKQDFRKKCGPIHGRKSESAQVLAAGYLTVKEACQRYPDLTQARLRDAVQHGRIPSRRIGRMIALKQKDVRRFVKIMRRWAEMKARK